jgi:phospholipid/cholesterol/gamma-HCH transport system substrate-binding protein
MMLSRRPFRVAGALAIAALLVNMSWLGVNVGLGSFHPTYPVTATFPKAGQNIYPGSVVDYLGVEVGKVSSIDLSNLQAKFVMKINKGFQIPADARATLTPESFFGNEVVELNFPTGTHAPYVGSGGTIGPNTVNGQLADLINSTVPLLEQISPQDLNTLVAESNVALQGQAPEIKQGLQEGLKLTGYLAQTMDAQNRLLDSSNRLAATFVPDTGPINRISGNVNQALPVLNQAEASFQHLLDTVTPLAGQLADFLSRYHPDFVSLINSGADISRLVVAQGPNVGELTVALDTFLRFITNGANNLTPSNASPPGQRFAYFQNFAQWSQIDNLVCALLGPVEANQPPNSPIMQLAGKLASGSTYLHCDAPPGPALPSAIPSGGAPKPAAAGPAAPSPLTPAAAAQQLLNNALGGVSQPQTPKPSTPQSFIQQAAGGLP